MEILGFIVLMAVAAGWLWTIWSLIVARRKATAKTDREEDQDDAGQYRVCWKCGYDLRATSNRCPECGTINVHRREYFRRLTEEWPDNSITPKLPGLGEIPVSLLSTRDRTEAEMIREQLIARGIACLIGTSVMPGNIHGSDSVFHEIMINSEDLDMARAYIDRVRLIEGPSDKPNPHE